MFLDPEPTNRHDANAVMVVTRSGEQLGYLPTGLAAEVVDGFCNGRCYVGVVANVLEPDQAFEMYGLEILVVDVAAEARPGEFEQYLAELGVEALT